MTINELLRDLSGTLQEAGYIHGQREAEIILGHVTTLDTAKLFTSGEDEADQQIVNRAQKAVAQRIQGRPLAYIIGTQQFLGLHMKTDERALIPRPETEQLVELLVKEVRARKLERSEILEVGTGAGPIAIALTKYFPSSKITATDISAEALELAEDNARRLGADITFIESDLLEKVPVKPYEVIVANLPYVPEERLAFVSDEILDWEPMVAVQAGEDGFAYIRRFLETVKPYTTGESVIALEMWHTHGVLVEELVQTLFPDAGVEIKQDLAGFDRFAIITRS